MLRLFFAAAVLIRTCPAAQLSISTYFKDGLTPTAIASDAQGNIYVAGSAVIDASSGATGAAGALGTPPASSMDKRSFVAKQASFSANGFQPVALNADSSRNSCTNPAKLGSTVSFFAHGLGGVGSPPQTLFDVQAQAGSCSTAVESASLLDGFLYKVDVRLPGSAVSCAQSGGSGVAESAFSIVLSRGGRAAGPRVVPVPNEPIVNFSPGQPMPMVVWATQ